MSDMMNMKEFIEELKTEVREYLQEDGLGEVTIGDVSALIDILLS